MTKNGRMNLVTFRMKQDSLIPNPSYLYTMNVGKKISLYTLII